MPDIVPSVVRLCYSPPIQLYSLAIFPNSIDPNNAAHYCPGLS